MSFRSRSRTNQPLMSKCRSWSGSRAQSVGTFDFNRCMNCYNSLGTSSTSYYKSSASSNASFYKNPIIDSYSSRHIYASTSTSNHNLSGYGNVVSSCKARHSTNTNYINDRYNSPYTSNYNEGITVASLSFNMSSSRKPGSTISKSGTASNLINPNSGKSANAHLCNFEASIRNLRKKKSILISNNTVDSYTTPSLANGVRTVTMKTTSRSNSLGKYEHKLRIRSYSPSEEKSSFSASSEKSEGYESGYEPQITSQAGPTVSPTHNYSSSHSTDDKKAREKSESSDIIDYKALWEVVTIENEKLKQQLRRKDDEILYAKTTLEKYTNTTTKNSLSEIEKRERRAMERKLSELEEELKLLQKLKSDNERLHAENRALTRVVSKLTSSAPSQLSTTN